MAEGEGWRAEEVTCRCGPGDPGFEEQHAGTAVAAVLSGLFTYRAVQGRAVLAPGAVLLGDDGSCFECGHEHGAGDVCLSLHFTPAFTDELLSGFRRGARARFQRPGLPPLERLAPLLTQARRLARAPDPLLAETLALGLGAAAFGLDQDAEPAPASLGQEARAARAARIIAERFTEPLTIAGLAAEVGLSRRKFATAFRRALGVSPYNYILSRRREAAAELLRNGSGSVLEIALDAGFGDLSEFTRRFRARFGRPPAAWRTAAT